MSRKILITGADGYLGSCLTRKVLDESDDQLVLWVRAKDREESCRKQDAMSQKFAGHADRITVAFGDLREEEPFLSVDPNDIQSIIHTAAVTRFNVEPELANAVNVEGTRKLLRFAQDCRYLERYGQVSTVYSSGLSSGKISESPAKAGNSFANHYERSKCEAEMILQEDFRDLPWQLFRAATIISDDDDGKVVQYNVFHNTMRLLFHGLISLVPGLHSTPIYLVTGRFTTDAIYQIFTDRDPNVIRRIYNVCHEKEHSLGLGELVDRVFENFASDGDFNRRRILKPLFTDLNAFEVLANALNGLGGVVVRQALESIRPFSKQMFICKEIQNENLRVAYPAYANPNSPLLIDNVVQHLIRTRWGRCA